MAYTDRRENRRNLLDALQENLGKASMALSPNMDAPADGLTLMQAHRIYSLFERVYDCHRRAAKELDSIIDAINQDAKFD